MLKIKVIKEIVIADYNYLKERKTDFFTARKNYNKTINAICSRYGTEWVAENFGKFIRFA